MKAIINACTYDFKMFCKNRYIKFDSEIMETGDMKDFDGADQIIDCSKCVIMPGFTNCHTHIYSTFSRGIGISFNPRNFKDILENLWWKLDRQLDGEAVYYSGLVYGSECIKNGVTSIIDHHASGLCINGSLEILKKSVCDDLGLRCIFCFETSDRFDLEECIKENLQFTSSMSEHHRGLFGLHASISLSDNSLREVSSCIGDIPIHIHAAESSDDAEDCLKKYGKRIIERLDSFNLLNKNSLLAHCVHITENEAKIIRDRECYAVLNPTSNMNNAVGLPDYELLREGKVICLLGNDGLGSNITREYLNIVFSMKNRLGSSSKFGLGDLVQIINNGYEYISTLLNIKIGRIEKGYKADMIAVPYIPPTPMDETNALGHLFFGIFDKFHPRDVWVSGKCLLKGYELTFDSENIFSNAKGEALKVWERISSIK